MSTTPDHVYDPNNWDCTYEWGDRFLLVEDAPRDEPAVVLKFATLINGPDKFAVYVVTKRDEDGDEIDGGWEWFDSEAAARKAGGNP